MVSLARIYAIFLNNDDGLDMEIETLGQLEGPVFPQWCVALLQMSMAFLSILGLLTP